MTAELHEHDLGLTWVMDEPMRRASHALADGGRVWLVDPVEDAPALERAAGLGEPVAVLQLLDRHNRDGAAIAARLGVPLLRTPDALPDAPFQPVRLVGNRAWSEVALWWPERSALVVPEAVGTAPFFAVGGAPVGVHLMLRLTPPRRLRAYAPEHLLVGHGPPLHGAGTPAALQTALARARSDLPRALLNAPKAFRG